MILFIVAYLVTLQLLNDNKVFMHMLPAKGHKSKRLINYEFHSKLSLNVADAETKCKNEAML